MEEEEEIYENETDALIADLQGYFKQENRRLFLEHCRCDDQWNWQILPYSIVCKRIKEMLIRRRDEEDDTLMYFDFRRRYEHTICKNEVGEGYTLLIEMIRWYNEKRDISDMTIEELRHLQIGTENGIKKCEELEQELQ